MIDPVLLNTDPAAVLPAAFLARVRKQLPAEEFDAFLNSCAQPPQPALRVNTLKVSVPELQRLLPFLTGPVPGTEDGFFYPDDARPGLSPYHEAGLYYIQEPSAMLPAAALGACPGERVLDLCAAPGGKTTAIAAHMRGRGLLVANEIHPKRAAILSQNVERLGLCNTVVTNHTPAELAAHFPAFFDRILVDAPCSGEGMFRKEPQALEMWSPENIALCAARQDEILEQADRMLRPGGRLVYSTCTFSPEEDEDCVSRFLSLHPDYRLIRQEKLWPHRFSGEGQFYAVLEHTGPAPAAAPSQKPQAKRPPRGRKAQSASADALSAWDAFAASFLQTAQEDLPFVSSPAQPFPFGDQLYLLQEPIDLAGLKVLRPGLHLGTMERGRFTPSHSLALALSPRLVRNVLRLSQQQACDWIMGLSAPCENPPGWCLICIGEHALGFGKVSGGQCKNHYPKGIRKKTVAI